MGQNRTLPDVVNRQPPDLCPHDDPLLQLSSDDDEEDKTCTKNETPMLPDVIYPQSLRMPDLCPHDAPFLELSSDDDDYKTAKNKTPMVRPPDVVNQQGVLLLLSSDDEDDDVCEGNCGSADCMFTKFAKTRLRASSPVANISPLPNSKPMSEIAPVANSMPMSDSSLASPNSFLMPAADLPHPYTRTRSVRRSRKLPRPYPEPRVSPRKVSKSLGFYDDNHDYDDDF